MNGLSWLRAGEKEGILGSLLEMAVVGKHRFQLKIDQYSLLAVVNITNVFCYRHSN